MAGILNFDAASLSRETCKNWIMKDHKIQLTIKQSDLVEKRQKEIFDAAGKLFVEKASTLQQYAILLEKTV